MEASTHKTPDDWEDIDPDQPVQLTDTSQAISDDSSQSDFGDFDEPGSTDYLERAIAARRNKSLDHESILVELLESHQRNSPLKKQLPIGSDEYNKFVIFYSNKAKKIPIEKKVFVDGENLVYRCGKSENVCSFPQVFKDLRSMNVDINSSVMMVKNTYAPERKYNELDEYQKGRIFNVCANDQTVDCDKEVDDLVMLTAAIHNARNGSDYVTVISQDKFKFLDESLRSELMWIRPPASGRRFMSGGGHYDVGSLVILAFVTIGMSILGSLH